MKTLGTIIGILCLILMLFGFLPLFGWLNWLIIPLAIIGLIVSSLGEGGSGKILFIVVIIFGILRLILGGGIL